MAFWKETLHGFNNTNPTSQNKRASFIEDFLYKIYILYTAGQNNFNSLTFITKLALI